MEQASEEGDENRKLQALNLTLLRENERLRERLRLAHHSFAAEWQGSVLILQQTFGGMAWRIPYLENHHWRSGTDIKRWLWSDSQAATISLKGDGCLTLLATPGCDHFPLTRAIAFPKHLSISILSAIRVAVQSPECKADTNLAPALDELIEEARKLIGEDK